MYQCILIMLFDVFNYCLWVASLALFPGSLACIFSAGGWHLVNPIKAQNTWQSFLTEWQSNLVVRSWRETYCVCQRDLLWDLLCDLLCVFLCLPGDPDTNITLFGTMEQWGRAGLHTAQCLLWNTSVHCVLYTAPNLEYGTTLQPIVVEICWTGQKCRSTLMLFW